MSYPTLIRCRGCGSLAPLNRCDGVETEVKKVGKLERVAKTTLYANYFYDCPFCGYSAVDAQPENSASSSNEKNDFPTH
jgi:hypothetical protein